MHLIVVKPVRTDYRDQARKVVHSATIVRYGCKDETRYGPARPRDKASLSPDLSF
jgi:hypothetical protein